MTDGPSAADDQGLNRTGLTVLVVGSGGREHALARKAAQSSRVGRVLVAPGNAGWIDRVDVAADDVAGIVRVCETEKVDLVMIGPEIALAAGLSDALRSAEGGRIAVFGPSKAAARLEWSKSYAREFCQHHQLPSPMFATFDDERCVRKGGSRASAAIAWAEEFGRAVVVKMDGLASGKGVAVPSSWDETVEAIQTFAAVGPIVLEERLEGEEVSLMAFCDGRTVRAMPPAQDHKRIGEGDTGLNTGGMGAYAPAPSCPPAMVDELIATVLQPTVDALAACDTPYVGVLYAGLMLTAEGPKLLEFNSRFGDPETQVVLPLLNSDLVEIALACAIGKLDSVDVRWSDEHSCTIVLAASGYPSAPTVGELISLSSVAAAADVRSGAGAGTAGSRQLVFHAGTALDADGTLRTTGGRVMALTGLGLNLVAARDAAYRLAAGVTFAGRQMRRDIGWRAIARQSGGYAGSGVNIDEGNRAVSLLKASVERTHSPAVLAGVGAFGGAFDVSRLKSFDAPVLVASTDGVGTKVMLAAETGRYEVAGQDIVNHCVNDVLVQRAEPLFFLDYVAAAALVPEHVAALVEGMSIACVQNGCALLGGETAEMPGVYSPGHFDVAGTLVGVCERDRMLPRPNVGPGDVLIGIASNGPHTNGYSLLRRVFAGLPLDAQPEPLDVPLGDALLQPHRSYLPVLRTLLETDLVKALVHITGGGLPENLPRALPHGVQAIVHLGSWTMPPLFRLVRTVSGLPDLELHRALNMGIGMVVIAGREQCDEVRSLIDEETWVIGSLAAGEKGVVLT